MSAQLVIVNGFLNFVNLDSAAIVHDGNMEISIFCVLFLIMLGKLTLTVLWKRASGALGYMKT